MPKADGSFKRARTDEQKQARMEAILLAADTLLDAQAHPENHRDLIVRVAGYSAFFNVLSRRTQDDIIERTEQAL